MAVLALGLNGAAPALAEVTPSGDTTLAATASQDTIIGNKGVGMLNVDSGSSLINKSGYVAWDPDSSGAATVSGAASKWTNGGDLYIGLSGSGTLTVETGAQVSNRSGYLGNNAGSTGTATISGVGSTWINTAGFTVGSSGAGTLSIEAGAQVRNVHGTLGRQPGGTGAVAVTGVGSTWTNSGNLRVGDSGTGRLTVSDGGLVTAHTLYASPDDLFGNGVISVTAGAVMDADLVFDSTHGITQALAFGSGGTLNLTVDGTGALGAGYKDSGSLTIADGTAVASSLGYLGYHAGSTGTATVSGAGSIWTSGTMYVGESGSGTLIIENGGQVISSSAGYLGFKAGSTGIAVVRGMESTWTSGNLSIGNGTLTVADGGLVTVYALAASLSDLHGNGMITARHGALLDAELVFDRTHGPTQTLAFGSGGTLNLTIDGGTLGVGYKGNGVLRITDGVAVMSGNGVLGNDVGSIGVATVSGAGSKWISSGFGLYIGVAGMGTLTIDSGGEVSSNDSYIGYSVGSVGTVRVSGAESTWTNSYLRVGYGGSGALCIDTGGQVTTSGYGYVGNDANSIGVATVSGPGSKWISSGQLFVGTRGSGTLIIEDGGQVRSSEGRVGEGRVGAGTSSVGTATVSGAGSSWTNSGDLIVGYNGIGTLAIRAGGQVNDNNGSLGYFGSGTAIVTGAGSNWTNSAHLQVGSSGRGMLTIADHGVVIAKSLSIGYYPPSSNQSIVRLHVSGDDMVVLGDASTNGSLTNNGTASFYADALLPAGIYNPISAFPGKTITWSGTGTYNAFGGIWDPTAKTFTVVEPTALSAGDTDTLTTGERLLFADTTGQRVGVSFGTVPADTTFSAAPMTPANLASLASLLADNEDILSAWTFTTNFTGGEAMLSFDIGPNAQDLSIWRFSNNVWSAFTPTLFTHTAADLASFTVSSFSGYAISGALPVAIPQWLGNDAETPTLWSTPTNWTTGSIASAGGQALFPQSATNKTVDLGGGTQSAGTVRFASNDNYTVQNGTLAINNNGSAGLIVSESGSTGTHTISAAVSIVDDATISVAGGKLHFTGGVSIASGKTLSVTQAAADALSINALSGGTLSLVDATVTKVTGDSSIEQLVMSGSAKLDLTTAELSVSGGDLAAINGLVATGRAGGTWDGIGINSSSLAADGAHKTLAVLPEGAGAKVKYTWAGDLTGDGAISGADYFVLDYGFLTGGTGTLYAQGNVNYSGGIDGDDYFTTDRSSLNQSTSLISAGAAAVPEPASLSLLAFAGSMLLPRRRK